MPVIETKELEAFSRLMQDGIENVFEKVDTSTETINKLDYHGITALVCNNLERQKNNQSEHSSALLAKIGHRKPLMVANEALRADELRKLFNALKTAGPEKWLVFKGTALAYSVYPEPWLRPRTDTDILIDPAELALFTSIFVRLGYQREFAITGDLISYQCTFGKRLVGDATINIDVHWRINNRQCLATAFTLSELLSRTQPTPSKLARSLGRYVKIPSAVDSIILACLHRLGHHHTEERLAWLYDIHLLALALNETDWALFTQLVQRKRLSKLCLNGLTQAQRYFHTDIPNATLKSLAQIDLSTEPSAVFLQQNLSDWQILQSDLRAIKTWRTKIRFLLQTALPSPTYIRERMGTQYALIGYLKRSLNGLKRLLP